MRFRPQVSPGEALTKEELQSGVEVANEVAESYQKRARSFRRLPIITDAPSAKLLLLETFLNAEGGALICWSLLACVQS